MADAVRSADELMEMLDLPKGGLALNIRECESFPLLVPRGFVTRMEPGDAHDPLLRQVLPLAAEEEPSQRVSADPLHESDAVIAPGLLKKYPGRVLLLTTNACAMHCRHCFRRCRSEAVGDWQPALEAIAADDTLHEIILSGGDPLCCDDEALAGLAERLSAVRHLQRLRIHSRLPVAIPERVTDALIDWLTDTRLTPILVLQVNHPREIDDPCAEALRRLVRSGIPVLNQSVLLRGVNDSDETLADLCERLIDLGVLPYYLHQLDRVRGAVHFEVPEREGQALIQALRGRLPGYAVPRYVREVPGQTGKTPLL